MLILVTLIIRLIWWIFAAAALVVLFYAVRSDEGDPCPGGSRRRAAGSDRCTG
jgi:hypothetical protein